MRRKQVPPVTVALCNRLIGLAALLVPAPQRDDWKHEWTAEIWHRWQFLAIAGEWNSDEAWRLVRSTLGALPDAIWHFTSQEPFPDRIRELARSLWMCISGLLMLLLLLAPFTSGWQATRELAGALCHPNSDRLAVISLRTAFSGESNDIGLYLPVAWAKHSRLIEALAPFTIEQTPKAALITTEPSFFNVAPPSSFHAFSQKPVALTIEQSLYASRVLVLIKTKPNVSESRLVREFTKIGRDEGYVSVSHALRFSFVRSTLFMPLWFFAIACAISALLLIALCRVRPRRAKNFSLRRAGFFLLKLGLALAVVFVAGLEWTRPHLCVLLPWQDGANGPLLLWFYIVGANGRFLLGASRPARALPRLPPAAVLPSPRWLPRLFTARLVRHRVALH